jgi:DNA-binding XRE family transcriptional regulator
MARKSLIRRRVIALPHLIIQRQINKTAFDVMSAIPDNTAMAKTKSIPLPAVHALRKLGRDLALARRKRSISTSDMASRLFVSRDTLWRLERGDPTVALGTLATAAFILKLHDRLANLVAPSSDELALSLDEHRLPQRIHRPRP